MKIAKKHQKPIIAKATWEHTVIIENLKEHKTGVFSVNENDSARNGIKMLFRQKLINPP